MQITSDGSHIYVAQAPDNIKQYLIGYMGATFSKAKNHCKLPRNTSVMNEMWLKLPDLRSVPGFMELGLALKAEKQERLGLTKVTEVPTIDERLREYQKVDAFFHSQQEASGIFNEMRTGKTPTVIMVMKMKKTKRNIIIVPASLLWSWQAALAEWMPDMKVEVVEKSNKVVEHLERYETNSKTGQAAIIISKSMLPNITADLPRKQFDLAIVDEAT